MKTKRILFLAAFIAVSFILCQKASAAIFDPSDDWKMIKTEHFKINFPAKIEPVAKRSAEILEEIFPQVTEKWTFKPYGRTEVILVDNTDDSNGMASVLPYNWMLIYVKPSDPDSSLGHYDDWLKMLLVHEFTHVVQIDAFGGAWWPLRVIMGKTIAPSGINPTWLREGMAQYDETIFTGAGRGRGSYSNMIVRTSVLEDAFPPIDVADGLSWKWPAYNTAYVFGLKFVQWLVDTYGEDKFLQLDKNIRSSIMLGMVNHQAKRVYDNKTFYELWREWKATLGEKYAAERLSLESQGLTVFEDLIPSQKDEQYFIPTPSPDQKYIAYSVASPHKKSEIRIYDVASKTSKRVVKNKGAVQLSWSADGKKIIFSSIGKYKRYYRYYDIYECDLSDDLKCKPKQLTKGMRARDPDISPDGKSIIYVAADMITDSMYRYDIETKKSEKIGDAACEATQFANPRFSPDGKYIVASVWKPKEGWRVYRFDAEFKNPVRLTNSTGLDVESRPSWTRDGKFILFSSDDSGISNLYRIAANAKGGTPVKLTNVLTGAFMPFEFQGSVIGLRYNAKGFAVAKFEVVDVIPAKAGIQLSKKSLDRRLSADAEKKSQEKPIALTQSNPKILDPRLRGDDNPLGDEKKGDDKLVVPVANANYDATSSFHRKRGSRDLRGSSASVAAQSAPLNPLGTTSVNPDLVPEKFKAEKYVAFGQSLFRPRFLIPSIMYVDDFFYAMLTTGATDPLRWHTWTASGTYRTDANFFGYNFDYVYSRFKPRLGLGASDFAVNFGQVRFGATGRQVHLFEHRRGFYGFFSFPIEAHSLTAAYFYEDHMPLTSLTQPEVDSLNLGKFAGFRFIYHYGDSEKYAASISRENGRNIKLYTTITNKHLGSGDRNEQVIFAGDWREFIRLYGHHVLALRAGGGITWGDQLVQGTFGMGGAIGEGAFASGGSYTYFPFRGLPVSALSRTRAMLFSGEYRFPIFEPQRGIGTVPFFIKGFSGALLSDFGNAWNAHEDNGAPDAFNTFFKNFLWSVGAELRGDFIIGHGLPIHGRLGYAVVLRNRERVDQLVDPILGSSIKYGMLILTIGTAF